MNHNIEINELKQESKAVKKKIKYVLPLEINSIKFNVHMEMLSPMMMVVCNARLITMH